MGTPYHVIWVNQFNLGHPEKTGLEQEKASVQTEYDCSPEYWTGWIVAYFQWYTGRSFQSISEVLSMREILRLYPTLHEVSEDRAVDTLNNIILKGTAHPSASPKKELQADTAEIERVVRRKYPHDSAIRRTVQGHQQGCWGNPAFTCPGTVLPY